MDFLTPSLPLLYAFGLAVCVVGIIVWHMLGLWRSRPGVVERQLRANLRRAVSDTQRIFLEAEAEMVRRVGPQLPPPVDDPFDFGLTSSEPW